MRRPHASAHRTTAGSSLATQHLYNSCDIGTTSPKSIRSPFTLPKSTAASVALACAAPRTPRAAHPEPPPHLPRVVRARLARHLARCCRVHSCGRQVGNEAHVATGVPSRAQSVGGSRTRSSCRWAASFARADPAGSRVLRLDSVLRVASNHGRILRVKSCRVPPSLAPPHLCPSVLLPADGRERGIKSIPISAKTAQYVRFPNA
ncbi:hypothetical protein C8R43DRAFT_414116 [Mycena crocata]|nr:hypothetical protein C8R43DRAFT_414116 [Mycena crocata]